MIKVALIFTNDWELFGDGSGNFYDIQHKPLKDLLNLFEDYGAKLTIMAEVMQQFAMLKLTKKNESFRRVTDDWVNILQESVIKGHDVQLHIHPQWHNSSYENNAWKLDNKYWKISSLEEDAIFNLINSGKTYLEDIIKCVHTNYCCRIFRAGSYCIQPEKYVLQALSTAGILADTSVTKGLKSDGLYDFSDAPSNIIPWSINSDLLKAEKHGKLSEFPIYSYKKFHSKALKKFFPKLYYQLFYGQKLTDAELNWMTERDKIKDLRYPGKNRFYKSQTKRNFKFYLNSLFCFEYIQLDYDYLPAPVFVSAIDKAISTISADSTDIILPIVASGHVKDMHNVDNIAEILNLIDQKLGSDVEYYTLSQAYKFYKDNSENYETLLQKYG